MGRKLFVGCSHTMGYVDPEERGGLNRFHIWQAHNYAEMYAKQQSAKTVIYASSGCGNREYVNFVADAFKKYDDIDEVFVQSTYWGRFPLSINPNLDEKQIFPLDFFFSEDKKEELIERYSIGMVQPGGHMLAYSKARPEDYDRNQYITATSPNNQPSLNQSSYMYIQMWHYCQTHLEQQDYFRDMLLLDTLCERNGAKLHIWNINDRCFIPQQVNDFYSKLKSTVVADVDALTYLKQFTDRDLEIEKVDSEHYNTYVHNLIAEHYIPYLRTLK